MNAQELILLDAEMPHLEGFEACRIISSSDESRLAPVVMLTALADSDVRRREAPLGGDDLSAAPIDGEALMTRMRASLRERRFVDELEPPEAVLASLSTALEAKDEQTRGHSERVAFLARRLGSVWGLPAHEQRNLWRAGLLHDVGKIVIPAEYLRKPYPLLPEELRVIQRHAEISHEICKPLPSLQPVLGLVRGHHERLDGSGYPDGLCGDEVTPALHCLIVAEAYSALVTARPHRRALTPEEAIALLREEVRLGRLLDDVVELLARLEQAPNAGMLSSAPIAVE
jgi:putative two-component system response regulator